MTRVQSFSRAFQAYQIANDPMMYKPRTVQMPLHHYMNDKPVYFDMAGHPLHIDYVWVEGLHMAVPYIALENEEPLAVPRYGELFPPKVPFDKSAYSLSNYLPNVPPPHRNKKVWSFCKMLPEAINKQYTLAEMMSIYGCEDLKMIETGVVMESLLAGMSYLVVVPGEEMYVKV